MSNPARAEGFGKYAYSSESWRMTSEYKETFKFFQENKIINCYIGFLQNVQEIVESVASVFQWFCDRFFSKKKK